MGDLVKGVAPGFLLMPAREYEWERGERIEIRVPLEGKLSDFVEPGALAAGVRIAGEDEFKIFGGANIYLLWEITRVLFAKAEYPSLKDNECFNVVALEKDGDELIIYGEIITNVSND